MKTTYPTLDKQIEAKRAAHPLNDKRVSMRAGTYAVGQGGKTLGGPLVGVVWAVVDGKAVLHFGQSERVGRGGRVEVLSVYGRALADVSDIIEVGS
jgi:hypothetical protein